MTKRDLVGYGKHVPRIGWPNNARIAVSIVVNYEEGSERSVANGDPDQESLGEWGTYPLPASVRNLTNESVYEYGSRAGIWRLLDLFGRYGVKTTFFACAQALEVTPEATREIVSAEHEIMSHGYRWEEHFRMTRDEERERIRMAVESIQNTTGSDR